MTKKKLTIDSVTHDFAVTENLIFELAKQSHTTGVHRSTQVDAIIMRCRDYVNSTLHRRIPVAPSGANAPKPGNPGGHRGKYQR